MFQLPFLDAVNFEVNYHMNYLMTDIIFWLADWDSGSNEVLTTPLVPVIAH